MAYNAETPQNVEVSRKIPPEMPLLDQLALMERYTAVHRDHLDAPREIREAECLRVLYPALFRSVEPEDLIAAIDDYIDWYNKERIQLKLGGLSPLQFREQAFRIAM